MNAKRGKPVSVPSAAAKTRGGAMTAVVVGICCISEIMIHA